MVELIPNLYVGSDEDVPKAKERGYTICSCCKDGPNGHRSILKYETRGAPKDKDYYFVQRGKHLALNLIDADDPAFVPDQAVNAAIKFIGERIAAGDKVLVHCNLGHSRGPSTALMYMRSIGELPDGFHNGYRLFKALYDKYEPGHGLRQYVKEHYAALKKG